MTALSPRLGQYWTELGKQFLLCSLFLSLVVFYFWLVFIISIHFVWLLDYYLLPTSSIYWCDFHQIHNIYDSDKNHEAQFEIPNFLYL